MKMSKIWFFIVPFLGILGLSFLLYMLPDGAAVGGGTENDPNYLNLLKERHLSIARLLSASGYILDAILMEDNFALNGQIKKVYQLEPDIVYLNITDPGHKIVGSLDSTLMNKDYKGPPKLKPLTNEPVLIQETETDNIKQLHYALPITMAGKKVAALYIGFKTNPALNLPGATVIKTKKSPLMLAIGSGFALVISILLMIFAGALKGRVLNQLVEEQEHLFSPKITSLKREEEELNNGIAALNRKKGNLQNDIAAAEMAVQGMKQEYETMKQQIASNPITQSLEKLKAAEGELLKKLEKLKLAENQLNKEIKVLKAQSEEVNTKLEADRQEEKALHDRLDLIKKKILRLEG